VMMTMHFIYITRDCFFILIKFFLFRFYVCCCIKKVWMRFILGHCEIAMVTMERV